MARFGLEGPFHAVTVEQVSGQLMDEDVPNIAGLVAHGIEGNLDDRAVLSFLEENQPDLLGMSREQGDVHAVGSIRGPERMTLTARRGESQLGRRLFWRSLQSGGVSGWG